MTVASLWKVLDKAVCGTFVGPNDLADSTTIQDDPIDHTIQSERRKTQKRTTIAVDLSIWICESFTSFGLNNTQANPWLHLVFARTVHLLLLGINLIFVIEGKSRLRDFTNTEVDKFRRRRRDTLFWKACNSCEEMLKLLGVIVVHAKAEGEACCALLNKLGIVDGIISNDGDCLLFGAKVVYTKFSIENLRNGKVVRYDSKNLLALVESPRSQPDDKSQTMIPLSRSDLIAFAVLTGSDVAGDGLDKVGQRKAIRFIHKCQIDNPLSTETASLDELLSWARASVQSSRSVHESNFDTQCETNCTRCNHLGSKRDHQKHGCVICGTEPGEPCFLTTADDRFRKFIRAKALSLFPKFDLSKILAAYMKPNENQLPVEIARLMGNFQMLAPDLRSLMNFSSVIQGHKKDDSQRYVKQAVGKLLARYQLQRFVRQEVSDKVCHLQRERPNPIKILKSISKNDANFYEVLWEVSATVTDKSGNGIDGYEFLSIESQALIAETYPLLIETFNKSVTTVAPQGDEQKSRRRTFLDTNLFSVNQNENAQTLQKERHSKKRSGSFLPKSEQCFPNAAQRKKRRATSSSNIGDDAGNLLRFISKPLMISPERTLPRPKQVMDDLKLQSDCNHREDSFKDDLFCRMGGYLVAITPVESNRMQFPPRNIYVHQIRANPSLH